MITSTSCSPDNDENKCESLQLTKDSMIEGDMILSSQQITSLYGKSETSKSKRNAVIDPTRQWPKGEVYLKFDHKIGEDLFS